MFGKRPTASETEDDLLQLQEDFIRSQSKPSAAVFRKSNSGEIKEQSSSDRDVVDMQHPSGNSASFPEIPLKKSRLSDENRKRVTNADDDEEDPFGAHDTHISKVLEEIVERDLQAPPVYLPNPVLFGGFPTVPVLQVSDQVQDEKPKRKESLFAKQFRSQGSTLFGIQGNKSAKPPSNISEINKDEGLKPSVYAQGKKARSVLLTGAGLSLGGRAEEEVETIASENMAKLEEMSEEKILQEQQELIKLIDPTLLDFLKSKKKNVEGSSSKPSMQRDVVSTTQRDVASTTQRDVVSTTPWDMASTTPLDVASTTQHDVVSTTPHDVVSLDASCENSNEDKSELPIKVRKDWIHMDEIEKDKMEWMSNLPEPPTADNSQTGQQARFDFQGKIISPDSDLPTHLGLHHHGKEPQRAGYSLEELFHLARSATMQQRVMALNTLAKIIINAREGMFHNQVSLDIIPALLDGGLLFVVRWALDDSTDNSMAAALNCLHALLVCRQDEDAADKIFTWHQGEALPSLCPVIEGEDEEDKGGDEFDENKVQKTDGDHLRDDVIKGLLKMQLLLRLRFILDKWRPSGPVVKVVLQILIRIARHSSDASYQIMICAKLLDVIMNEFIPDTWQSVDSSGSIPGAYGYPSVDALKLIRVLCASGRNLSAILLKKYRLISVISRYISQDSSASDLPAGLTEAIQLESYRVWTVLTSYGLASASYRELYPILSKALQKTCSLTVNQSAEFCCCVIKLHEMFISVAASHMRLLAARTSQITEESQQVLPDIDWSHVHGLQSPVEMCLRKLLTTFINANDIKGFNLALTTSCLDFLATFYSKMGAQPGYNAVQALQHLEDMVNKVLLPCIKCRNFQKCLELVRHQSVLLDKEAAQKPGLVNLPYLGSLLGPKSKVCPILDEPGALSFATAFCRLIVTVGKIHRSLPEEVFSSILKSEELLLYLRKSCSTLPSSSYPIAKFENLFTFYIINMAKCQPSSCDIQLYHQVALFLLTHLQPGDESMAHQLLSTVIFNQHFLGKLGYDDIVMESLHLEENRAISSATGSSVVTPSGKLLKDAIGSLASIRGTYLKASANLLSNPMLLGSAAEQMPCQRLSLLRGQCFENLVPLDWIFLPILDLYGQTSVRRPGAQGDIVSPDVVATVKHTLCWTHFMESLYPNVFGAISFVTKYSRLICTFLAGSDLFLDKDIHAYLEALLRLYCKAPLLDRMDFSLPVPGLSSFYDLYILLLQQFEAVSFGDALFSCYVLLPLQQRHNVDLRRAVWGEFSTVLLALSLPVDQLPLPIESFLEPDETDINMVQLYIEKLFSGAITARRQPTMYLIAVHHMNRFIYTQDGTHCKLRERFMTETLKVTNEVLRDHLLKYKKVNLSCDPYYMDLYEKLPAIRQRLLDNFKPVRDTS